MRLLKQFPGSAQEIRDCFAFVSICFVIGTKKLVPLSEPIRYNTKTNHELVTHVFPRFRRFGYF